MNRLRVKNYTEAFTLIELLTVFAVIAILAGFLLGSVGRAKARARETQCTSNLRQLAHAVQIYRNDYEGRNITNPPWLSTMYGRTFKGGKDVYLCPADTRNGLDIPRWKFVELNPTSTAVYPEVADNMNNAVATPAAVLGLRNPEIQACSYFYEFGAMKYTGSSTSGVDLDGDGIVSWYETKIAQMNKGDSYSNNHPYSQSDFAMIRCTMHMRTADGGGRSGREVLNAACDSRVYRSGVAWQTNYMNN